MKKLFLSLLLVLPLCGFAQKGMQGVGGGLGFGLCYDGDCIIYDFSIKYQNNLTNRIRIVPYLEYISAIEYNGSRWVYDCGLSFHYFLNNVRRFRPYVIAGFSVGAYERVYLVSGREEWADGPFGGFEFGVGFDYRLSYHCSFQMEIMGLVATTSDVFSFGPNIGLAYTF